MVVGVAATKALAEAKVSDTGRMGFRIE